jgi:hypothetical protein
MRLQNALFGSDRAINGCPQDSRPRPQALLGRGRILACNEFKLALNC